MQLFYINLLLFTKKKSLHLYIILSYNKNVLIFSLFIGKIDV